VLAARARNAEVTKYEDVETVVEECYNHGYSYVDRDNKKLLVASKKAVVPCLKFVSSYRTTV
jgi:hypothetical protein